jgi:hypothetical protein
VITHDANKLGGKVFDSLRIKARVFLIIFQSVSAEDGAIHTQKDGVENKEAP